MDKMTLLRLTNDASVTATGASPQVAQIGPVIPDDKVRRVWRLSVTNNDSTACTVQVYVGDSANYTRTLIDQFTVPANSTSTVPACEADVHNPQYTLRPTTSASPTQNNQISLRITTSGSVNITARMSYYDLRG